MTKYGRYIASSFGEIRCCDEQAQTVTDPGNPEIIYGWRAQNGTITCVIDANGKNTGYAHVNVLEKFDTATGLATGDTKLNVSTDANYIPDYIDLSNCAVQPPENEITDACYITNSCDSVPGISFINADGVHTVYHNDIGVGQTFSGTIRQGNYTRVMFSGMINNGSTSPDAIKVTCNTVVKTGANGAFIVFDNVSSPFDINIQKN